MPLLERAGARPTGAGHAEILDDWLGTDGRLSDVTAATASGDRVDWNAPVYPVELAYDTADHGLPSGVRVVVREGSRRLMFETSAYEVVLRVASNDLTRQHELAGQVLFQGLPLAGAVVRLDPSGSPSTTATDQTGGFQLPLLAQGAYRLRIAVDGAVLMMPPIMLP